MPLRHVVPSEPWTESSRSQARMISPRPRTASPNTDGSRRSLSPRRSVPRRSPSHNPPSPAVGVSSLLEGANRHPPVLTRDIQHPLNRVFALTHHADEFEVLLFIFLASCHAEYDTPLSFFISTNKLPSSLFHPVDICYRFCYYPFLALNNAFISKIELLQMCSMLSLTFAPTSLTRRA